MKFCSHRVHLIQILFHPKIKKPHEKNGAARRILSREECQQRGAAGILANGPCFLRPITVAGPRPILTAFPQFVPRLRNQK
jgi:hypothetical protein